MILELIALSAAVGLALGTRRAMQRRRADRGVARGGAPAGAEGTSEPRGPGLQVGDVLLYADTELWLAGRLDLEDDGIILSLFSTPGSARATHVAQLDREGRELAILRPTEAIPAGRVADELVVDGGRARLRRRGRARVRMEGEPPISRSDTVDYVWLGSASGRIAIVIDGAGGAPRLALSGEQVPSEMLDLLPGR